MDNKALIAIALIAIIGVSVGGYYMWVARKPPVPATITGKITDADTGKPVEGVIVTVDGQSVSTASDGTYSFTIDAGSYTASVSLEGYEGDSRSVVAAEGKTHTIDFSLTPIPPPTKQAMIVGKITDIETGNPLEGATVSADGYSISTESDGGYSLTVDVGSYTVSVSFEDYEMESSSVDATEEKTYTIDFSLTPIAPPKPTKVVLKVITRHGADITFTAEKFFLESEYAKKYKIEDIKWLPVGATLWTETIKRTGDIDIGWGGGPVLFDTVYREQLLAPLTSDEVEEALMELPDEIGGARVKRYDEGEVYWVGAALSSFGFTINMNYLEDMDLPEPTTWIDLANETYAVTLPSPSIGTADATKSTSNTRMFEIILQGHGWQGGWKLLTLKGANSRIFDRSESVRDAAIIGEIGAGTTIDFYGYTAQLENPGICKYILPQDGTIVNADPIALLKTSPNAEAAQSFIAWVISVEGQKPWLSPKINRLPINPKVFDTPEGKERADLKEVYDKTYEALTIPFSDELSSSYEYSLMYFYHATIVRPQLKLVDAWMDITDAEFKGDISHAQFLELLDKLGDPHMFEFTDPATGSTVTFTQEYAQSINEKFITDATFKEQIVTEWIRAAEARYESVLDELSTLTG